MVLVDRSAGVNWRYDGHMQLRADWHSAGYERDVRFNVPRCCELILMMTFSFCLTKVYSRLAWVPNWGLRNLSRFFTGWMLFLLPNQQCQSTERGALILQGSYRSEKSWNQA